MSARSAFERFWFSRAPAARLAWLRILIGGYAVFYLISRFGAFTNVVRFHALEFVPVGPTTLLAAPLDPPWVFAGMVLSIGLGIAFFLGFRFRVSGPAFALSLLWVSAYRNSWGMKFHVENLLALHVLLLAGSRAADDLSLDARRAPAPIESHGRYGWVVRALCVVTVTTYALAGIAKLKLAGTAWLHGDYLRAEIAHDNLRKIELGSNYSPLGAWLVAYTWPFGALAWLTLVLELGAPIALIGGRVALVWAALAWSFHVGVAALMVIIFPYQLFGFAFFPLFALERAPWLAAIARFLRAKLGIQTTAPATITHSTGLPPSS
ncbi:MAG TPA: HTTM domain-containing protein [Polyangiaceae bacterium]|nr:HTTM domain-containing protein [Polyangiaceae bacterium]